MCPFAAARPASRPRPRARDNRQGGALARDEQVCAKKRSFTLTLPVKDSTSFCWNLEKQSFQRLFREAVFSATLYNLTANRFSRSLLTPALQLSHTLRLSVNPSTRTQACVVRRARTPCASARPWCVCVCVCVCARVYVYLCVLRGPNKYMCVGGCCSCVWV